MYFYTCLASHESDILSIVVYNGLIYHSSIIYILYPVIFSTCLASLESDILSIIIYKPLVCHSGYRL